MGDRFPLGHLGDQSFGVLFDGGSGDDRPRKALTGVKADGGDGVSRVLYYVFHLWVGVADVDAQRFRGFWLSRFGLLAGDCGVGGIVGAGGYAAG